MAIKCKFCDNDNRYNVNGAFITQWVELET